MVNFLTGIKSLGVCGIASFATAAVHMPTALPLADRIAFRPPATRGSGDGDFVPGPRGGGGGGGARAESAGRAVEPGRGRHHRHAYAVMMYMGTPRDYVFYVAVRVTMRSLARVGMLFMSVHGVS